MKRARAGFTLVELMVGLAVGAIVLSAIAGSIIAMNGIFNSNGITKTSVESGRVTLAYLERTLPKAGYGIPPQFAFDFNTVAGVPGVPAKDNEVTATHTTDDLAFRWRDPTYLRMGNIDVAGTSLTLSGGDTFGIPLKQGQTLMVACVGSAEQYLMVRTTAAALATDNAVPVLAYGAPFPVVNDPCLQLPAPNDSYVMILHEARVRVMLLGTRPFLVVHHKLAAPLDDFDVLAADVENFQVSYVMNQPPPAMAPAPPVVDAASAAPNWVLGDDPAVVPDLPNAALIPPSYKDGYATLTRFTRSPANIRAVRIAVTLKSQRAMANQGDGTFPRENIGNFTVVPVVDKFYRLTLTTQILTPNMSSRGLMTPSFADAADPLDRRNKWGG